MKDYSVVSRAVVRRLPRYRRVLRELLKKGNKVISSTELAKLVGFKASQIRQDLNNFGTFGLQGYGYNVERLHNSISAIMGLKHHYRMIVVGAGNLGQAIANYTHFYKSGFDIIAIFDVNPKLIGLKINDIEVLDYSSLEEFLRRYKIDIGIVTVNGDSAQSVADQLVKGGVKGIWNFAMADLAVPDEVAVENVHMSDSLYMLTYHINQKEIEMKESEKLDTEQFALLKVN